MNWSRLFRRSAANNKPALPCNDQAPWTLSQEEENYKPVLSVKSFRTKAFVNLAKPDAPVEYLDADYIPAGKRWRLRLCVVEQGRTLADSFNQQDRDNSVFSQIHKSTTLMNDASFMAILQKMAAYEFGTDTGSAYALREKIEENLSGRHFIDVAHNAGVVFDARQGHPSMTQNGRPLRDGEYPQKELEQVASRYNGVVRDEISALLAQLRTPDMAHTERSGGLSSFDSFNAMMRMQDWLSSMQIAYKSMRRDYAVNSQWGSFFQDIFTVNKNVIPETTKQALAENPDYQPISAAIDDLILLHHILIATTMIQYYNQYNTRISKDTLTSQLSNVDALLKNTSYDEEREKAIRSFIMSPVAPEVSELIDSISSHLKSLSEVVDTEIGNIFQQSRLPERKQETLPTAPEKGPSVTGPV